HSRALPSFPTRRSSDLPAVTAPAAAPPSPVLEFWLDFRKNSGAVAGLVLITVLILLALSAHLVAPHSPVLTNDTAFLRPPFWQRSEEHTSELQSRENLV